MTRHERIITGRRGAEWRAVRNGRSGFGHSPETAIHSLLREEGMEWDEATRQVKCLVR